MLFLGEMSLSHFYARVSSLGTAAVLQQMKELNTGIHEVSIDVTDLQGAGETQTMNVRICQCRNGACMTKPSSVSFGALALLAMLLPLALLLLLCESPPPYSCQQYCVGHTVQIMKQELCVHACIKAQEE